MKKLSVFFLLFFVNFLAFSQQFVHSYQGNTCIGSSHDPIQLIGVNFWAYDDEFPEESLEWYANMFDANSFHEVSNSLCMNVVRLNMDFRYFEYDDSPYSYLSSGWNWLDEIVSWASDAGVYLILDMHSPQGGYQSYGYTGNFWGNSEADISNQNRLIALWKEIANRYKDSTIIAGYDMINEPLPEDNSSYWNFMQRIVDTIRTVDTNHMLIVEQAFNDDFSWQTINDNNYCIDVHFYSPWEYVTQPAPANTYVYPNSNWGYNYTSQEQYLLEEGLQFALDNTIPLNIGEYGIQRAVLENQSNGWNQYLNDYRQLLNFYNLGNQIWSYQASNWGLYEPYNGDLPMLEEKSINLYTHFQSLCVRTGIDNKNLEKEALIIFPNPTKFDINMNVSEQIVKIIVYNTQGEIEMTVVSPPNNKVNISNLSDGLYFIYINTENSSYTSKFIKNRQ